MGAVLQRAGSRRGVQKSLRRMGQGRLIIAAVAALTAAICTSLPAAGAAAAPVRPAAADVIGQRTMRAGQTGADVMRLQRTIAALGYAVRPDGQFGVATRTAVLELERLVGPVAPDGAVTRAETRRYLALTTVTWAHAVPLGARSLARGRAGTDVRALQEALSRLGWAVRADGIYGPTTERAVRDAEVDFGAEPDGQVSRSLAARIEQLARSRASAAAPQSAPASPILSGEMGGTAAG